MKLILVLFTILTTPALAHVTVTDTTITTHMGEVIPRFAVGVAPQSGDWSDVIPANAEGVRIEPGVTVTINGDANCKYIEVFGTLRFDPSSQTTLTVETIYIMPGGTLTIGTEATPITGSAEIIFADTPIDANDPEQFGHGLINLGTVETSGRKVTPSTRATAAIKAGDVVINAVAPADWRVGDEIVLPGTAQPRQVPKNAWIPTSETAVIAAISGDKITLESPVKHNHFGTPDNPFGIALFPHVGNLTRNIVIRSANRTGIRAHTMSTDASTTKWRDVAFISVGRTTGERLSATNHIARYATHAHHVTGSFSVERCSIRDAARWAIDFHATNNGIARGNVIYDVDGGGIVTEGGLEVGTIIDGNLVVQVNGGFMRHSTIGGGGAGDDIGVNGSAYWFRTSNGSITGNAAYECRGFAYSSSGYGFNRPDDLKLSFGKFDGNEAAGSKGGLWLTWAQGQGQASRFSETHFDNTTFWNIGEAGVTAYHEGFNKFHNTTIVNDASVSSRNDGSRAYDKGTTIGVNLGGTSYENIDFVFTGLRISGCNVSIAMPATAGPNGFLIDTAQLESYVNLMIDGDSDGTNFELRNVTYLPSRVTRISEKVQPTKVTNVFKLQPPGEQDNGIIELGAMAGESPTPGPNPAPDPTPDPDPISPFVRRDSSRLNISGMAGDDVITVSVSGDLLTATVNGQDFVFPAAEISQIDIDGLGGDDTITSNLGLAHSVRIYGRAGNDTLTGGDGHDQIRGGDGDDVINGRGGDDKMYGGPGADTFINFERGDSIRDLEPIDTVRS